MVGSTDGRRKPVWIASAGYICLGAGSLFVGGCTINSHEYIAATKKDSPRADAQIPKAVSAGTLKKNAGTASNQLASTEPAGKVRISDLNQETRAQMVSQIAARKVEPTAATGAGSKVVAPENQPAEDRSAPATDERGLETGKPPKAKQAQKPATAGSTKKRPAGSAAADASVMARPTAKRVTKSTAQERAGAKSSKREPQSGDAGKGVASNHERRRADVLMERAHSMLDSGYREEALRLASVAAELEKSQQAVYWRGEERPSKFIVLLQNSTTDGARPVNTGKAAESVIAKRPAQPAVQPPQIAGADQSAEPRATREIVQANTGRMLASADPFVSESSILTGRGTSQSATGGPALDAPARTETARSPVTTVGIEDVEEPAPAPEAGPVQGPLLADAPVAPAAAAASLELDAADSDAPATSQAPASQLTIASLLGLIAGVAGMFGLGWWRRQERRHYAAAKKTTISIHDPGFTRKKETVIGIHDPGDELPAKRAA